MIVTVPLGVLQSGAVEWTPELPTRKLEAIRRLKMGHYKKVLLTWRDCWWKQIADAPFIVCVESPAGAAVEPGAADTAVLRSDFTVFYNLHWQLGAPMLEATVAGRDAQLLGRYSDAQIQTAMVARLRRAFAVAPPTKLARSSRNRTTFTCPRGRLTRTHAARTASGLSARRRTTWRSSLRRCMLRPERFLA